MTVIKRIEFRPEIWQRIIELARQERRDPRMQVTVMIEQAVSDKALDAENNGHKVAETPATS